MVSLVKGQKVSLSKSSSELKQVFVGLGWDPAKKGFFGFGGGSIDLDASCMMFDENKQLVDTVWFRQLHSKDGSVLHSGDNLTGEGDGDDEVINVNLEKVPQNVKDLVFVITSFRGQTFSEVESAVCRLVNKENGVELARYELSDKGKNTASVMARVSRDNGGWMVQALGLPANGTVQSDLVSVVKTGL